MNLNRESGIESPVGKEDLLHMKKEGQALADDDPKKAVLLLSKAGKGFLQLHEVENARKCFQQALAMAEQFLKHGMKNATCHIKDDVFEDAMCREESIRKGNLSGNNRNNGVNGIYFGRENSDVFIDDENNNSVDDGPIERRAENGDEFRSRSQTRPRIKRFKMEKMSRMYSNYKLQRGTADLYETMVQCYAESFDIDLKAGADENEKGQRQSLKLSEILMNRDLVLKELADTEKTYVDSLEFLVKTIIPAFNSAESQLVKNIAPGIFANIEQIYDWHSRVFHDKIEDCLEDPDLLGPTFKEHEKELTSLYEQYCQNKPEADDLLMQYADEVDQVYQSIETTFTILDYLIKPVQRVMKYQLLLQSILKYTKKMGEDTASIQTALEVMEVVPKKVNDKMHLAMIIGYAKSLERDELVLQDTLNVSFDGGKAKPKKYRLFLFNGFLLFAEPIERLGQLPRYKFCLELKTSRMGVTQTVENDRLKFAIWSRKFKTTDIYVCTADTREVKISWLSALSNVLSVNGSSASSDPVSQEINPPIKSLIRTKRWSAEQIVRQATIGHPREYSMSSKLKANIQKYLMEELCSETEGTNSNGDSESSHESDMKYENGYSVNSNRKKQQRFLGKCESFSDESIKSSDDQLSGPERQGSLRSILEGNQSKKDRKGFRLWKSMKGSADKQEKKKSNENGDIGQRSSSLPDGLAVMEKLELQDNAFNRSRVDDTVKLDDAQIFEFRSMIAELKFLLVQSELSLSWETAEELLDSSLGLFYDVKTLKDISKRESIHKFLFNICETHHRNARERGDFKKNTIDNSGKFYSYRGLKQLLTTYADLSAANTSSPWPILLYSMATEAAKIESEFNDAFDGYKKLSQIYKLRKEFELSVDCLVEAYQIKLSTNDVESATSCLKDALQTALTAGNVAKCHVLEGMATKLFEKSKEFGIETPCLQILIDISFAYRRQDYAWFNKNYSKINECDGYLENQDKLEFRELLTHLLEHWKERKHSTSGEVFV